MDFQIQPCTHKDAADLAQFARKTFIEAFSAQNNPEDFDDYLQSAFSPEKIRSEMDHPESEFYWVISGVEPLGYCKLNSGAAQSEPDHPAGMEIERIYIKSAAQGKGLGGKLLCWIKRIAAARGKDYLWLGVWELNPEAIKFYQKHGFITFGKHPYFIGKDKQTDLLMRFNLNTTRP